jgi:hypothetical protein
MKSIKTNPNSIKGPDKGKIIEWWKNKNIDGFYTKTTQKGGFSKLCVKIKKKMLYRPTPFFNTSE